MFSMSFCLYKSMGSNVVLDSTDFNSKLGDLKHHRGPQDDLK